MELSISTSHSEVQTYPSVALNEPELAPDPSKTIASWASVAGRQASMFVIAIKLTVPPKTKPPERIDSLALTLMSSETMNFPSGYWEQNNPFHDRLEVESAAGMAIQAGSTYYWDVPVLIPCNAAPYERGRYGRNYWRLSAKMQLPGLILKKQITSEKNLFIIAYPLDEAYSYDHVHSGLSDGLGPVQLSFISRSFNVGGYLRGAMLLPAPSPAIKLHAMTMSLLQTAELHSRKKPGHVEHYPVERYEFLRMEGEELQSYVDHTGALVRRVPCREAGGAIQMEWITRLPRDHQARPTTVMGGDAHIRHSHQLEFVLLFDTDGSKPVKDERGNVLRRRYRVTWPVSLLSCALRWRSIILPEYSEQDANPVPERDRDAYTGPNEHEDQTLCNCGERTEEFLKYEDITEGPTVFTTDLMRQGLRVQTGSGRRVGRSARRRGTTPAAGPAGSTAPNGSGGAAGRSRSHARVAGEGSVTPRARGVSGAQGSSSRNASRSRHGSPSTSRRPSRSRRTSPSRLAGRPMTISSQGSSDNLSNGTPDRLSIEFAEEEDEYAGSGSSGSRRQSVDDAFGDGGFLDEDEGDAWDSEDDEELMNKLERERQKREQLYTTTPGRPYSSNGGGSGAATPPVASSSGSRHASNLHRHVASALRIGARSSSRSRDARGEEGANGSRPGTPGPGVGR